MIGDSIIGLARRMKLRVIAEGVETSDQLHYLRANNCDEMQGYFFSKALPADEFEGLLRSGKQLPVCRRRRNRVPLRLWTIKVPWQFPAASIRRPLP